MYSVYSSFHTRSFGGMKVKSITRNSELWEWGGGVSLGVTAASGFVALKKEKPCIGELLTTLRIVAYPLYYTCILSHACSPTVVVTVRL